MLYEEGLIWNGSFEADESMSFKSSLIKENVAKIGSFGVWGDQEITNQEVHDQYVAVPETAGRRRYDRFLSATTLSCRILPTQQSQRPANSRTLLQDL